MRWPARGALPSPSVTVMSLGLRPSRRLLVPPSESFPLPLPSHPLASFPTRRYRLRTRGLSLLVLGVALLTGCDSSTVDPPPTDSPFLVAGVSVGNSHACAISTDDRAFCWGDNTWRQLGDASAVERRTRPVAVADDLRFTHIDASHRYTCGLTFDERAYCWGDNTWRQLGSESTAAGCTFGIPCRNRPTSVDGDLRFVALTTGNNHACGLVSDGRAYCWGENGQGQLGSGEYGHGNPPREVAGGHRFAALEAGGFHTCGLKADGQALCWGANMWGQLGVGAGEVHPEPVPVSGGHVFSVLRGGYGHTCGLAGETAYCWGENDAGQLGTGTVSREPLLVPTAVAGGLAFADLSAGSMHTCGITPGGQAYCWGANANGELGDGTDVRSAAPKAVAGGLTFSTISAASGPSTCGRTGSGEVYCWGANTSGQLGTGTQTTSRTPVRVLPPL
jgi:alpha-tubulin suppressor-like RCC1 family protein